MARVCILVANNCISDSRVLRQAETFARAGHETIIVAVKRGRIPSIERRNGFEIRRIPWGKWSYRERLPGYITKGPIVVADPAPPPPRPEPSTAPLAQRVSRAQWMRWLRTGDGQAPRAWTGSTAGTKAERFRFAGRVAATAPARLARAARRKLKASPALRGAVVRARKRRAQLGYELFGGPRAIELRQAREAVAFRPDIVWANDANTLRPGYEAARATGARLFYDAHEAIWDAVAWPEKDRKRFSSIESTYVPKAERRFTVCEPIAREIAERYKVPKPDVLYNAPRFEATQRAIASAPSPLLEHRQGDEWLVLFHGGLSPHRGLEQLVHAFVLLPADRYRLIFMGAGRIKDDLVALAAELGLAERVTFLPPVPPEDLPLWLSGADVGLIPYQKVGRNHIYSTPNKLFECMHAGVPLVVNDLPEVRRIVTEVGFGVITDCSDPAAIAKAIGEITADRAQHAAMRANAVAAASRYSWEEQERTILDAAAS